MNRLKTALVLIVLLTVYGLVGEDDYQEAMRQAQESHIQTAQHEQE